MTFPFIALSSACRGFRSEGVTYASLWCNISSDQPLCPPCPTPYIVKYCGIFARSTTPAVVVMPHLHRRHRQAHKDTTSWLLQAGLQRVSPGQAAVFILRGLNRENLHLIGGAGAVIPVLKTRTAHPDEGLPYLRDLTLACRGR